MSVLRAGGVDPPELENGTWRYRVRGGRTNVIVAFRSEDTLVVIPHIADLHRVLAHAVVRKSSRLTPAEIRFLRRTLGWSGQDFADRRRAARWPGG